MNNRQARKIVKATWSKRLSKKLNKLYPSFVSVHPYYRFNSAWRKLHKKIRKYGDNFKML